MTESPMSSGSSYPTRSINDPQKFIYSLNFVIKFYSISSFSRLFNYSWSFFKKLEAFFLILTTCLEKLLEKNNLVYFRSEPEVRRFIHYDSESELNFASFEHTFVKFGEYYFEISKIHVLRRRKIFRIFFVSVCRTPHFKSIGPFLKNRLVTLDTSLNQFGHMGDKRLKL